MLEKNRKINSRVCLVMLLLAWCFLFVATATASSLVPSMVGNVSPAPYVASSSSFYNPSSRYDFRPYRAFDGQFSGTSYWSADIYETSGILGIDFGPGNAQAVNIYRILCQDNSRVGPSRAPREFVFQGSDDGLIWADLDARPAVTDWAVGVPKEFSFDNTRAYRYYRLNVLSNNGNIGFLAVQEMELDYGESYVPPSPSASPVPVLQYKSLLNVTYPTRIAQAATGDIYVASGRDDRVNYFDKYGRAKGVDTSVVEPTAVATSPSGDLYIASGAGGIYKSGSSVPFIDVDVASSVSDMAFDSAGYLYVADNASNEIKVFYPGSSNLASAFGGGEGRRPVSVAVGPGMLADGSDIEEQIYVGYASEVIVSLGEPMIVVYEPGSWEEVRSFGEAFFQVAAETTTEGVEGIAEPYQMVRAGGIAVDSKGRVYVADSYGGRVVMFDEFGDHFATTEPMAAPPRGIAIDEDGRLLVSILDGSVRIYSVDGSALENIAPTAPRFVSPVGGVSVAGDVELLVMNSNDLNGDTIVYEFVLASDPAMGDVVWSQPDVVEGESGKTSVTVGAPLDEDATYYWKARSLDGRGEYSQYSPVTAFFVNGVNSAPVIISSLPEEQLKKIDAEEALDFSVETFDSDRDRLALIWLVDGELVSGGGSSFEFIASVDERGPHKVIARVSDREFVVDKEWDVEVYRPNTKPVPPSVASPIASEDVDTLNPVLTVSNASDAEGDKLNYDFEVSTVSDFSPGSIVAVVSGVTEGEGVTSAELSAELKERKSVV